MTIKDFLSALNISFLILAAAFSVWAEWGPYAWVAEGQVAVCGFYSQTLTTLCTAVVVLVPGCWMLALEESHAVRAIATGIVFAATCVYLGVAVHFLTTKSVAAPAASFSSAVRSATVFPQPIALTTNQLAPMDVLHTVWVYGSNKNIKNSFYVPFMPAAWVDKKRPVILRSAIFDMRIKTTPLEGNIRVGPIPYLVRRYWPSNRANLAIIITTKESVHAYWTYKALFSALLALAALNKMINEIGQARLQRTNRDGWRRALNPEAE